MSVAASPVTCGVAMLVPIRRCRYSYVPAFADVTSWPGATTFGFMRPSPVGPRLLVVEMSPTVWYPLSSTLPTVRAFLATPGFRSSGSSVRRCRRRPRRAGGWSRPCRRAFSTWSRCRSGHAALSAADVDHSGGALPHSRRRLAMHSPWLAPSDAMVLPCCCSSEILAALMSLGAPHARGHAPVAGVGGAGAGDRAEDVRAVARPGR